MKNYVAIVEQLELLSVKESNEKRVPAKRVDIVSLRLVKETSLLCTKIVPFEAQKTATTCLSSFLEN